MFLKLTITAGAIFAGAVWFHAFGLAPIKNAILTDPNGERQAIQIQIESIKRIERDSSAIKTIEILDTLAGVN